MKIALVHLARNMNGTPVSPIVDHLGLECIAGCLQAEGNEVSLIDSGPSGLEDEGVLGALCTAAPDLAGFALNYVNVRDTLELVVKVRSELPRTVLVAGGHYATFHVEQLLRGEYSFDTVVMGEGEMPMVALAKAKRGQWMQVPGLAFLQGDKVVISSAVTPPELDALPIANRSVLRNMALLPRACIRVAVEASRGCHHNCSFCSIAACQALTGNIRSRRVRSPHIIADEIGTIVQDWGLKDFWFMDADFLGDPNDKKRILEIAEAIESLSYDLTLEIDARADSVQREVIRALRSAGLERAFLGIESFDQATLNSFSKGTTAKGNLQAIEILLEEGVRPILGSILFHPASTLEQIRHDHEVLSSIGYEKTQMLFRLKKYRGSKNTDEVQDYIGCDASLNGDYGWKISNPTISLIWKIFDRARLQLLDAVFTDMTALYRQNKIEEKDFQKRADSIFHGLKFCMDFALDAVSKNRKTNEKHDIKTLLYNIDEIVTSIVREQMKEYNI